ncbi:hypothetical protein D1BOALGB6SA_5573 [Olavius sp. associated proteobacterium Delta 1]|nr:hypothetical protein D1BOALGB6SA_5573 [Olavius sp. associated proteobacterium Delta 1]
MSEGASNNAFLPALVKLVANAYRQKNDQKRKKGVDDPDQHILQKKT